MQKTISSKLTFFMKVIFPVMWFFSLINVVSFISDNSISPSDLPKEFGIFFWIFGLFIFYWFYFRLKKVCVFGDFLYVSNFMKEIQISLTEVEKITENILAGHNPVTIHLKTPSEFGRKILFMPTFRFFAFFSSHPITDELRNLVMCKKLDLKFKTAAEHNLQNL